MLRTTPILNAARVGIAIEGASIFVTKFPCLACCNAIIQAGITRIYTHDDWYWNDDPFDTDHSRKKEILRQARVRVEAPNHLDFSPKEIINPNKKKGPMPDRTVVPPVIGKAAEGD